MGMPLKTHEQDVAEMKKLVEQHPVLQRYISHHVRTGLTRIKYCIALDRIDIIGEVAGHVLEDLEIVGL